MNNVGQVCIMWDRLARLFRPFLGFVINAHPESEMIRINSRKLVFL